MAQQVEAAWKDLLDVVIEVLGPAAGSGWSPIVCSIRRLHITGGRADWSSEIDPSFLTADLQNVDGSVQVRSGWQIRVSTDHHQVFIGRVHNAIRSARPDGTSVMTVYASDTLAALSTTYLEELDVTDPAAAIGAGDTFKERVDRLLDLAHWPTADRDLDDRLAWDLEGTWLGRSVLDELRVISQSVGGWLYLSRDGKITTGFPPGHPGIGHGAQVRMWRVYAEGAPADHHPVCARAFQTTDNLDFVVNDVHLQHHGIGAAWVSAHDTASQTAYGVRSYVQDGLQNLHHLADLAAGILAHGKDPHERLRSVEIPVVDPQSASLLDQFAMGDSVRLSYDNGRGDTFVHSNGFIVGWSIDLSMDSGMLTLRTGHPFDVRSQTAGTGSAGGGTGQAGATGPPGPTGPQGPRGTMWFEGSGPPTSTNPPPPHGGYMIGDAYLDGAAGELFTHTATGWSDTGIDLKGIQGIQGVQGVHGPTGPRGSVWSHTDVMPPSGTLEPSGGWKEGDQILHSGDGELFVYKAGAWADEGVSILGPQGVTGPHGPAGAIGHDGPTGPRGATGPHGPAGAIGHDGPTGPQGATGPRGQGLEFLTAVATVGDLPAIGGAGGIVGDLHLVVADGNLYTPHNGAWVSIGHVQGPEGPQGKIGPKGDPGRTGQAGATGPHGPAGAKGDPGATGHAGKDGATGPAGPRGAHGSPGATGPRGLTGKEGPTGPQGPRGAVSFGTADLRYLRLDTSNDPFTGVLHGDRIELKSTGKQFTAVDAAGNGAMFDLHAASKKLRITTQDAHGFHTVIQAGVAATAKLEVLREVTAPKLKVTSARSFADWQVRNIWIGGTAPAHPIIGDIWFES